jgi:hypothetical protein
MKRILFVDDEPMILAGLQNLLRKQRKQWDMTFVESGEALAKMEGVVRRHRQGHAHAAHGRSTAPQAGAEALPEVVPFSATSRSAAPWAPSGGLPSAAKVYVAVTKALDDPDTSMADLSLTRRTDSYPKFGPGGCLILAVGEALPDDAILPRHLPGDAVGRAHRRQPRLECVEHKRMST